MIKQIEKYKSIYWEEKNKVQIEIIYKNEPITIYKNELNHNISETYMIRIE